MVERFRDELGDWRLVLHSPFGGQVHAPWALAIAARLRERYGGMDVQAVSTDDGIVIRVPDADDPPPGGIAMLDPEEVEQLVTAELGSSALFASRFRECAARALLLPRRQPGRRTPLWQQRQRSAQLLSVASQYSTFPIVLETVRECLKDVFDVPGLTALMRDLSARRVRLVEVETPGPSPFSRSLLFRYIGAFMYEGDAPLAERRAQALALDSALLADLLGQADMRELLDPVVVEEAERELQHLAAGRTARDEEAVADLLRSLGPLATAEVAERSADPPAAPAWLASLAGQRRVIEVRVAGQPRWAAIEDAGRLRDALGVALPVGVPVAFTEPTGDPLRDLVLRYARTHGPFTAIELAERFGLGVAVVTGALHRLAAEGAVTEGEFRPGGRGTEWCAAAVLRLLRRRCLAKLRKEVEPVPAQVLAAFLPAWQHAGQVVRPGGRSARVDAVYDAVEQLAGVSVPASALETLVLPGRVPGYTPALLDELTSAGDVAWSGAGGLPGGDGWVVLAPAESASVLLPEPGEITMTPVHEALLAVLGGGGALFFRALADRVAAMLASDRPGDPGQAGDQAVASAIWDLVWSGRLTNDTLAPLRTVLSSGRPLAPEKPGPEPAAAAGSQAVASQGLVVPPRPPVSGSLQLSGRRGPATAGPCSRPAAARRPSAAAGRCCRRPSPTPPGGSTPWPSRCSNGTASCCAALPAWSASPAASAPSTRCCGPWRTAASAGAATSSRAWARPSSPCPAPSTGCARWPATCCPPSPLPCWPSRTGTSAPARPAARGGPRSRSWSWPPPTRPAPTAPPFPGPSARPSPAPATVPAARPAPWSSWPAAS